MRHPVRTYVQVISESATETVGCNRDLPGLSRIVRAYRDRSLKVAGLQALDQRRKLTIATSVVWGERRLAEVRRRTRLDFPEL